jgi:hypothetical protein
VLPARTPWIAGARVDGVHRLVGAAAALDKVPKGGVQLVISDAHTGLRNAIGSILLGASWQTGYAGSAPGSGSSREVRRGGTTAADSGPGR